ncbi:MAG: glycerol-3-phosphate 1-O-acyltransferase PlsY [Lachnospiraceae bacterium]|nr:glycerol-3-phosphate 1-O-acyltransferase PlsY [Lachnospiraceae bacterium]
MAVLSRVISLVIGYFCGCVLFGYLYSKKRHEDITSMGSGNAGTTNVMRNFGWKAALMTLLGDLFKVVVAMGIVYFIFKDMYPESVRLLKLYAGLGAVVGHNHPFYMKDFKGGKGIACTAGIIVGFCPIEIPICLAVFVLIVAFTRYVSVGSILVCISFFVQTVVFGEIGLLDVTENYSMEVYILAAIIMISGIVRHRENIKRLMSKTENKFEFRR